MRNEAVPDEPGKTVLLQARCTSREVDTVDRIGAGRGLTRAGVVRRGIKLQERLDVLLNSNIGFVKTDQNGNTVAIEAREILVLFE